MCNMWLNSPLYSQCTRPVKPKAKNAKSDETTWQQDEVEWRESTWETDEYEASKGKKGKGKRSKSKGKSKGKGAPRSTTPRPAQSQCSRGDRSQPKAKPEARSCMTSDFLFAMMSTKPKPTWRHSNWNGTDYMICTVAEPQKKPRYEELHTALRHSRAVWQSRQIMGSERCGFLLRSMSIRPILCHIWLNSRPSRSRPWIWLQWTWAMLF